MPRKTALSDTEARILIKEVKSRGCLWDHQDDRYNDRYHMARAWTQISEIIRMPEDSLRVKWKNMRDLYKKELKKNGANGSKWRHFEALTFLNKHPITSNVSETNEDSSEGRTVLKQEYIDLEPDADPDNNEVEVFFDGSYEEDPLPEKRMKVDTDNDYDVMFLKSLAPYFKQLDPIRKLVVRSKMQDMLLNEIAAQASSTQFQLKKS